MPLSRFLLLGVLILAACPPAIEKKNPGEGGIFSIFVSDLCKGCGECVEQCDCGDTNPCGEYIFNHSGAAVNGQTFRDWYINEYMISNETLFHKKRRKLAKTVIKHKCFNNCIAYSRQLAIAIQRAAIRPRDVIHVLVRFATGVEPALYDLNTIQVCPDGIS